MHDSVREFVARVVRDYGLGSQVKMVLEVGSFDVNGGVRDLIPHSEWIGLDYQDGPGVDLVVPVGDYSVYRRLSGSVDLAVSTEALEHDPRPWETLRAVSGALRDGGLLVLTARGFGPDMGSVGQWRTYGPHDYPADYWRFSVAGMRVMLEDAGFDIVEAGPDTDVTAPGVFVVADRV